MINIQQQIKELSTEFGTNIDVMEQFVRRFCPKVVPAGQFAQAADTMLFVHIPKTAGVSVGKAFQETFDRFYSVQWDNIGPSFRHSTRMAMYSQTQKNGRQVIMGHFGWPELQVWRNHEIPIKCGTIFRDPVARMISDFNYNCSPAHPQHAAFKEKFPNIEVYIRNTILDFQITQAVGFISSFQNLLEKLIKYYTFLGITEKLAWSLTHLSVSHKLQKFSVHRENIGRSTPEKINDDLIKLIEERSHNDQKLHQLLTRIYQMG